jgi:ketosteroid isomerase-like protein
MHARLNQRLWAVLVLICGSAPLAHASEASDRVVLENVAQSWIKAFNSNDVDTLIALATPDVVLLDPDDSVPVSGTAAAREALGKAAAVAGDVTSLTKEVVVQGDVAWRISVVEHKLPSGESFKRGSSLEIWKRAGSGWKLHRIAGSIIAQPDLRPRFPNQPVLDAPLN